MLNDALVHGNAFEGCTETARKIFYPLEKEEVKMNGLKCGLNQKRMTQESKCLLKGIREQINVARGVRLQKNHQESLQSLLNFLTTNSTAPSSRTAT